MGLSAFNRRRRAEANKLAQAGVADTPVNPVVPKDSTQRNSDKTKGGKGGGKKK